MSPADTSATPSLTDDPAGSYRAASAPDPSGRPSPTLLLLQVEGILKEHGYTLNDVRKAILDGMAKKLTVEALDEVETVLHTQDVPPGFSSLRAYFLARGPVLVRELRRLQTICDWQADCLRIAYSRPLIKPEDVAEGAHLSPAQTERCSRALEFIRPFAKEEYDAIFCLNADYKELVDKYRTMVRSREFAATIPVEPGDGVVPASALFWYRAAKKAERSTDAAFCMGEAYNHLVGQLYALRDADSGTAVPPGEADKN